MQIDDFLSRLQKVKKSASGWQACCPAHEDRTPSLSISMGDDGRILTKCFAGCDTKDICDAMGIKQSDLFNDNGHRAIHHPTKKAPSIDFAAMAKKYQTGLNGQIEQQAKRLGVSAESLRRLGCGWNGSALTVPMRDENESAIGIRLRDPDGRKKSITGSLMGMFIPGNLQKTDRVFLPEGFSDTACLLTMGLPAVGRPNNNAKIDMVVAYCRRAGIETAIICSDNDDPGREGAAKLAEALAGTVEDIRIISPKPEYKDFREEYRAGGLSGQDLNDRAEAAEPNIACFAGHSGGIWEFFDLEQPALPSIPLQGVPEYLSDTIQAVSEALSVAPDMPAGIALAIGGLCLSQRIIIKPYPDWVEQPNLYVISILDPGERKTQTLRIMTESLEKFEAEENESRAEAIRESHRKKTLLEKRIEKSMSKAAGIDDAMARMEIENQIHDLDRELAGLVLTYAIRLLAADITPEKLARLLYENEGRIGIITAEDILSVLTGRQYSQNGESNLSAILSGYSGDTIRVDRQGREPILIHRPAISLCLCVQNDVLKSLRRDRSFRGRGLLDRFIYIIPESRIGSRAIETKPIPDNVKYLYDEAVRRLLRHPARAEGPVELGIDPAAMDILNDFRRQIEPRLGRDGDLYPIAGWGSKLPGQIVRIAAILHGYSDPDGYIGKPIEANSMEVACRIGEYLIEHSRYAFGAMGIDEDTELAKRIGQWLKTYPETTITKRDIFCRFQSTVGTVEAMDRPLEILIDHGYIRTMEQQKGEGRPSVRYEINSDTPKSACNTCKTTCQV